jgi:small subunit ribosomal protein S6
LRDYELVLVVKPDGGDEAFTAAVERFSQAIKDQGGEVTSVDPWGMRKLAYPIERHMEGFYSVTAFKIEPSEVRALEDSLGRAEDLLRHMVVRQDHPRVAAEAAPASDESREAEGPVAKSSPDGGEAVKAEGSAAEAPPVSDESVKVEPAVEASPVSDESVKVEPAAEASPDSGESAKVEPAAEASPDSGESPKVEPAAEASPDRSESPKVEVAAEPKEAEAAAGTQEESGDVGA